MSFGKIEFVIAQIATGKTALDQGPILFDPRRWNAFETRNDGTTPECDVRLFFRRSNVLGKPLIGNQHIVVKPQHQVTLRSRNGAISGMNVSLLRLLQAANIQPVRK